MSCFNLLIFYLRNSQLESDVCRLPYTWSLNSLLERLRVTFTQNCRREFVPRDQVPLTLFSVYSLFYTKISSSIPVLTIGIVRDCFYLPIFYSEKFLTWILISLLSRSTTRRGGIFCKSKMTSKQPPFPQWLRGRNLLQISRRKFAHDINLVQICSNLRKIPWVPRWGVNCNTRVQFSKTLQPQSQKTHFGN